MRIVLRAVLVGGGLVSLSGCLSLQAHPTVAVPLAMPAPPTRVVMPPPPAADPVVEDTPSTVSVPDMATPPAANKTTPPPAPKPAERPPVTAPPPEPPPVLQTTADTTKLQQRIEKQIDEANRDLNKVVFSALSEDARAQYLWAQSFLRQARAAMAIRNFNLADVFSDKAARVASLLVKGSITSPTSS